jgi:hypothetical protein
MAKSESKKGIPLSDLVQSIRSDLLREVERRQTEKNWQPMFKIEDVELELNVRFAQELEAGGGVKAYVVDLFYKGKQTNETTHKIKLKLKPLKPLKSNDTVSVATAKADTRLLGSGRR